MESLKSLVALGAMLSLALVANAIGPHTDLVLTNEMVAPDGFSRPAVLAGGRLPGPPITGKKGDRFKINVINQLEDHSMLKSTSIHWHGFFQHTTAWADGAVFVTQCPITSGTEFLYDFPSDNQVGTFWYHSHLLTQYCDGLRGPLVIYDPHDPYRHEYDFDDANTIITLMDWYHTIGSQTPVPATPAATLINGLGRHTNQTEPSELAVIKVRRGRRYRMRLVNMACDPDYVFSIDRHDMTIIELDGQYTKPRKVDSLKIFVGQRYSFIFHANQPVGNYWIRAKPGIGNTTFAGGLNSAILRYFGAPKTEPRATLPPNSTALLREQDLRPLRNKGVPGQPWVGGADININLAFSFAAGKFKVNNVTFANPELPALLQIMNGAKTAQELLPQGSYIPLPRNAVVEVSMPGGVIGGGHPLHMHGHAFHVIRSAGSTDYNYKNPPMRDVTNIGTTGDNVTIRFTTDNPGPWFLHCHIDFHFIAGFAVVFAEDIDDIPETNPVPDAWKDLCPAYAATPEQDR